MADVSRPDLCIIGGGSAGLFTATAASAFGASVILVEKGEMGGDCLNSGCVPSKALIAAARHAEAGRAGSEFGVSFEPPRINFGRIHQHVADTIAAIAPNDSIERFEGLGVTVIRGQGRFIDKKTLEADGQKIRARRFVVATGSRPLIPPIPGLETVSYLTNETIFDLTRKPAHLIIIGAGPVGLELAQAHRRLGCTVTVIEARDPLADHDAELVAITLRRIVADGVTLKTRTEITGIAPHGSGVTVTFRQGDEETTITGSHLLVAAGRKPNIEDFGLDRAGISTDDKGIRVNSRLRTSNRRVYAIGDVIGGMHFTHVASYHAGFVIRSALFGLGGKADRSIIPMCTYTDPEIATIGMSEAEALRRYPRKAKILRWSYAENDRARTDRLTDGLVKLMTHRDGRILGAAIAGTGAGELIAFFAYAMANRQKIASFARFVAPYPSLSDMAKRLAVEHYRDKLAHPWLKYWFSIVRHLP